MEIGTIKSLSHSIEVLIRFNEADPLGIVWHGHYIRYFEDGREAFGKKYGIGYMDFIKKDVVIPIVHTECNYKRSLRFGDSVRIESIYRPTEAAKIVFDYNLYKVADGSLVATGSTTQVFLEKETLNLLLNNPPFFDDWKKKHLLV